MYPEISLGPLTIQSFGLMGVIGFWVGAWLASIRFAELGKPREWGWELIICGMLGGVLGASINYALQNGKGINDILNSISNGPGMIWFGGVAGFLVFLAVWGYLRNFWGWDLLGIVTPGIISVQLFGRIGCQLSGDGDYGIAWDGPWAMSYPNGTVPTLETVHPTPIYEALGLGLLLLIIWNLRKKISSQALFACWMIGAGLIRFPVEFIRRNEEVLGPLTVAQIISLLLIVAGGILLYWGLKKPPPRIDHASQ